MAGSEAPRDILGRPADLQGRHGPLNLLTCNVDKRYSLEMNVVRIGYVGDALWERIDRAVDKVKDRLARVIVALKSANIQYAVVGGNAVQIWVAQVDESAVRNTRDVDIILNRSDLDSAIEVMEAHGFIFHRSAGGAMFLDGPDAKARDAVHVVFAGEKVREEYCEPVPTIEHCEHFNEIRILPLELLVKMKLTSFRDKDRVHLRDMLDVGLIDATWLNRFSPPLQLRLKELLDNPDG